MGDNLRCEFYEHAEWKGRMLGPLCPGDYPDLSQAGWNDRISSLRCWTETEAPAAPGGDWVVGVGTQKPAGGFLPAAGCSRPFSPPLSVIPFSRDPGSWPSAQFTVKSSALAP